jgi:glycosyltransferase involved in cell wall biosynthesis
MPVVSLITAAYNAERYLGETIASAQAQTFVDFEMIIVDDGSTDGTADLVRTHAARDPRVRLFSQANAGISAARNRALGEARGNYACVLDADDLFHPEKLQRQVEALAGRSDAFCLVGLRRFADDDAGKREWLHTTLPPELGSGYLDRVLNLGSGQMVMGSTALIPTAVLRDLGGWDRRFQTAEDWDLWLRLSHRLTPVNVPDELYFYRKHASSVTRGQSPLYTLDIQLAIVADKAGYPEVSPGQLRRALAGRCCEHGKTLAAGGDFAAAAGCLRRAARYELVPSPTTLVAAVRLLKRRLGG